MSSASIDALTIALGATPQLTPAIGRHRPIAARWTFEPRTMAAHVFPDDFLSMSLTDYRATEYGPRRNRQWVMRRGALALAPAGNSHRWVFHDPADMLHLYLPGGWQRHAAEQHGIAADRLVLRHGPLPDDPFLVHGMELLLTTMKWPHGVAMFTSTIAMAMTVRLMVAHGDMGLPENGGARGGLPPHQLRKAQDLMDDRLASDLTLGDVARHLGLSPRHFARAFRQSTGLPPHQWLLRRRIERATVLLRDGDSPLADVAVRCGFADQSHFTSTFRRATGTTPGRYRGEARG